MQISKNRPQVDTRLNFGDAARRSKLQLERVIGLTASHNASVSINPANGDIAYPAGCILVVYQPRKNRQARFLRTNSAIHCLDFAADGSHIAVGGKGPATSIEVWDINGNSRVCELKHHRHGVAALAFSPSCRFLVSVGFRHDGKILVWDWRQNIIVAEAKLPRCRITSLSFAEDGTYFSTAGEKHLQFWPVTVKPPGHISEKRYAHEPIKPVRLERVDGAPAQLLSRPAIMPDAYQKETFIDIASGMGAHSDLTFALTASGSLCVFDASRTLDHYVHVKSKSAFALSVTPTTLAVGCADSTVRVFRLADKRLATGSQTGVLTFAGSLPLPPAIGQQNVTSANSAAILARGGAALSANSPKVSALSDPVRPAAMCVRLSLDGQLAAVIYGDRSFFVWDIQGLQQDKVVKYRSFLHHAGPVWDVAYVPSSGKLHQSNGDENSQRPLPPDTFVTVGTDCTVRFWNMDPKALPAFGSQESHMKSQDNRTAQYRNIFCRNLLHVLYINADEATSGSGLMLSNSKDSTSSDILVGGLPLVSNTHYSGQSWPCQAIVTKPFDTEHSLPGTALLDLGVKTVAACLYPEKQSDNKVRMAVDIAVGDRQGNLRVFDAWSMKQKQYIAAHDAEIVALQYSPATGRVLITGSRDKLVHVFDVRAGYRHAQVLDFHAAPITSARFSHDDAKLLTCSSDATAIFSRVRIGKRSPIGLQMREELTSSGYDINEEAPSFEVDDSMGSTDISHGEGIWVSQQKSVKTQHGAIYDVDVDATNRNVVTVGQDKKIRVWGMRNAQLIRTYALGNNSKDLNRVCVDPSGLYVACSGVDKVIRLHDFYSGACLARMAAHSELITGIAFSSDCKRMVSTSGDGCIMVWRLSADLTASMQERLKEIDDARNQALTQRAMQMTMKPSSVMAGENAQQQPVRPPVLPPAAPVLPKATEALPSSDKRTIPEPAQSSLSPVYVKSREADTSMIVPIEFRESVLPSWAQSKPPKDNLVESNDKKGQQSDTTTNQTRPHSAAPRSKWAQGASEGYALFGGQVKIAPPVLPSTQDIAAAKRRAVFHFEDDTREDVQETENVQQNVEEPPAIHDQDNTDIVLESVDSEHTWNHDANHLPTSVSQPNSNQEAGDGQPDDASSTTTEEADNAKGPTDMSHVTKSNESFSANDFAATKPRIDETATSVVSTNKTSPLVAKDDSIHKPSNTSNDRSEPIRQSLSSTFADLHIQHDNSNAGISQTSSSQTYSKASDAVTQMRRQLQDLDILARTQDGGANTTPATSDHLAAPVKSSTEPQTASRLAASIRSRLAAARTQASSTAASATDVQSISTTAATSSPTSSPAEKSTVLPRSSEEYTAALEEFSTSALRLRNLFDELNACRASENRPRVSQEESDITDNILSRFEQTFATVRDSLTLPQTATTLQAERENTPPEQHLGEGTSELSGTQEASIGSTTSIEAILEQYTDRISSMVLTKVNAKLHKSKEEPDRE